MHKDTLHVCVHTAICKIVGNRATDFNGFLYQFTTGKSLKTVARFPIILQSPVPSLQLIQ